MISDLDVAHIATAGAAAVFLITIPLRLICQKYCKRQYVENLDADTPQPHNQQALIDDPDITVPPNSGFGPNSASPADANPPAAR